MARKTEDKTTFLMSDRWAGMVKALPNEKAGQLMKAIFAYHGGECIEIDDPVLYSIFVLIRETIDENDDSYKRKCKEQANRVNKRWHPEKDTEEYRGIPNDTEEYREIHDSDSDYEGDSDYDLDNDNGFENPTGSKENTHCAKTDDVREVLDYLNTVTMSHYRGEGTKKLIRERLKEGFTVSEMETVIDKMDRKWRGTDMERYIRPETLFAKSKFEGYLNEPETRPKMSIVEQTMAWGGAV